MGRQDYYFVATLVVGSVVTAVVLTDILVRLRDGPRRKNECAKKAKIIQPVPQSTKVRQASAGSSVKAPAHPVSQGRLLEK